MINIIKNLLYRRNNIMKKEIITQIENLEKEGITDIDMLALITKTTSEIIFYGKIQGKIYQSNNMVEENLIDSLKIEKFYENIVKIIRSDKEFREEKMNIVKVNREKEFSIEIEEKNCKVYKIKKEWKNEVYNV
ncbi:hypothetical protein HMPREF1984_01937 [Leptotrichia sp. oral taxon 215 str. W9775]|uniref:hypothetical protein n=1 Tax=Leptotrichia sp. oral taxon 215 TaxID=712359 RepID=UPI0003ADEEA2|nr:hypothetical protein [Leptotrichia sp. oral taxon 215]ERK65996.1 hypothetical protein HMPREF1984_01937 [Leptotrichia sp. oral taxon 215 str. W9775]